MSAPNYIRGYVAEKEFQALAEKHGLPTRRAWKSDGRALGEDRRVDMLIAGKRFQCKRRKQPRPAWFIELIDMLRNGIVDFVGIKQDRKGLFVIIPADEYFRYVKSAVSGEGEEEVQA